MTYIHSYIHSDIQTYRHTDIQTYRHTDIQTYKHTDKQTNRQTDKQTDRHTDIHLVDYLGHFEYCKEPQNVVLVLVYYHFRNFSSQTWGLNY